jgi:hypothetical protein
MYQAEGAARISNTSSQHPRTEDRAMATKKKVLALVVEEKHTPVSNVVINGDT